MSDEFESWRASGLARAEIVQPAYPLRGAHAWFPHGYRLTQALLGVVAAEVERGGYEEVGLSSFVSKEALRRQAEDIKDFFSRVFLASPPGQGEQVIKPTIEAQISGIFASWCARRTPLPFKVYTARTVGRFETGKTAPLWKERLVWPFFEAHAALDRGMGEEIDWLHEMTIRFCRRICLPILGVERLKVNKRLREYAHRRLEGITIMPSGRITVLTSIYDLGDRFSRALGVQTHEGLFPEMVNFAFSGRLVLAMLGHHFVGRWPVHPSAIAPIQVAVLPTRGADPQIGARAGEVASLLNAAAISAHTITDGRPLAARVQQGRALGAPVRLLVGSAELADGGVEIEREFGGRRRVDLAEIERVVRAELEAFDEALWERNLAVHASHLVRVQSLASVREAIAASKTTVSSLCREEACIERLVESCGGEVIGRLLESGEAHGSCLICAGPAEQAVVCGSKYVGEK